MRSAQPAPKRVAIHMLRDVGADQFTEALVDGIKDNHSEAEIEGAASRASKQLAAIMAEMKEAKKGMCIPLDWLPAAGTAVTVDGKPTGKPIPGEDFYRALLRDLARRQAGAGDLKKALLGQAVAMAHHELTMPDQRGAGARAARQRHGDAERHALRHPRRDADPHVRPRPQDALRPARATP